MQVKHLVQHGNSKALVIDKSILNAAGKERKEGAPTLEVRSEVSFAIF